VTKEENRDGIKKTEREREIEKRIRLAGDLI
jgi:hypothetical protein